jgi:Zn-dependent protease with chaperone function
MEMTTLAYSSLRIALQTQVDSWSKFMSIPTLRVYAGDQPHRIHEPIQAVFRPRIDRHSCDCPRCAATPYIAYTPGIADLIPASELTFIIAHEFAHYIQEALGMNKDLSNDTVTKRQAEAAADAIACILYPHRDLAHAAFSKLSASAPDIETFYNLPEQMASMIFGHPSNRHPPWAERRLIIDRWMSNNSHNPHINQKVIRDLALGFIQP